MWAVFCRALLVAPLQSHLKPQLPPDPHLTLTLT